MCQFLKLLHPNNLLLVQVSFRAYLMRYFFVFSSLIIMTSLQSLAQMAQSEVTIRSNDAEEHVFTVEVARSPEEVSHGLMERTELASDSGMLFDFGQTRETNMWMKNTLIPLDMLFLASDGTIVAIARNTTPLSERRINPGTPVRGVLEIPGGRAAELGIEPGDKLESPIFSGAQE